MVSEARRTASLSSREAGDMKFSAPPWTRVDRCDMDGRWKGGRCGAEALAEWLRCWGWLGGWEKAFGWGRKVGLDDGFPRAVASSSSSESELMAGPMAVCCAASRGLGASMFSAELVITWSSSLSVSSYSSWLLVCPCAAEWAAIRLDCDEPAAWCGCCFCKRRFRLGPRAWLPTRRPVVIISSPMDEREDDDGWDAISTHDSASVSAHSTA